MERKQRRTWPLFLIGLPAAVAVWSGWVGLGTMCGFGIIHPLPGIFDSFQLNTAITLPVGVEAYGGYALGVWADVATPKRVRRFAFRSAIGSLLLGLLGQVVFHLLSAAGYAHAPWPVVVFVSCIPVAALGFGMGLHQLLIHTDADEVPEVPEPVPAPLVSRVELLDELAGTITLARPRSEPVPPAPPEPVHHEDPPAEPAQVDDADADEIAREAAELFAEPAPSARTAPASEPAAPARPAAPETPRPAAPRASAQAAKWTPESAGIELDELRELISTLSRNKLADRLGVGRSTASNIIREYGPVPALNGSGG